MEIAIPVIDKGTLKILCPACKSGTLVLESKTQVHCTECRATFPVPETGIISGQVFKGSFERSLYHFLKELDSPMWRVTMRSVPGSS